ncbi:452_t:CDS:2 [Entrophospora sp. SA101]|nr:452_t:CDS:2 [Entrophospora sp. SA101]
MPPAENPYFALEKLLENDKSDIHLIDFHAETTAEKAAFAHYFAGKITALWGTHTHVQTADERILPPGTAFITDLGMTGPSEGIIGAEPAGIIQRSKYNFSSPMRPCEKGQGQFNGLVLEIDDNSNKQEVQIQRKAASPLVPQPPPPPQPPQRPPPIPQPRPSSLKKTDYDKLDGKLTNINDSLHILEDPATHHQHDNNHLTNDELKEVKKNSQELTRIQTDIIAKLETDLGILATNPQGQKDLKQPDYNNLKALKDSGGGGNNSQLQDQLTQAKQDRDKAAQERDGYKKDLENKEKEISQKLNTELNLQLTEPTLAQAITKISELLRKPDNSTDCETWKQQLSQAQQTIIDLEKKLSASEQLTAIKQISQVVMEKLFSYEISQSYQKQIKNVTSYQEIRNIEKELINKYLGNKENYQQEKSQLIKKQTQERIIFGSLLVVSLLTISSLIIKLKTGGQDQFRGWFNSSLITSVILTGKAPYQQVLSHGFVVDEKGYKMSKSLGNVIDPEEVISQYGADILRCWVVSSDFTKEVKVSIPILTKIQESYHKIRNTLRFLLGNLANLPPEIKSEKDLVHELNLVDYYLLHRLEKLVEESEKNFQEYSFNPVYSSLLNFCINDLSSFYLEISKDSLYCDSLSALRRKQIITTLYYLLAGLLKVIAPILPYLAEEVYQNIPCRFGLTESESVFLTTFSLKLPCLPDREKKIALITNFLLPLRQAVYQALEQARQEKIIATNSQAQLTIYLKEEQASDYSELNLPELLLVAKVEFPPAQENKNNVWESDFCSIVVKKTAKEKCLRC